MSGLAALRERIRRIERPATARRGVVPLGVAAIDRALPGGGLVRGALHEILGAGGDEEDGALAAAFIATILARFGDGPVLWCLPRPDLYGPGLAACGLDPARLVLVRARRDVEILWAMEEGLRTPGLAAVVGEVGILPAAASRRLQLAAERSGIAAFALRRWHDGAQAVRQRSLPTAAATRWRVAALPSQPHALAPAFCRPLPPLHCFPLPPAGEEGRGEGGRRASGSPLTLPSPPGGARGREWHAANGRPPGSGRSWLGPPRWRVELLRCRGGVPAAWEVEVTDATGALSVAAALGDRPAAAEDIRQAG